MSILTTGIEFMRVLESVTFQIYPESEHTLTSYDQLSNRMKPGLQSNERRWTRLFHLISTTLFLDSELTSEIEKEFHEEPSQYRPFKERKPQMDPERNERTVYVDKLTDLPNALIS